MKRYSLDIVVFVTGGVIMVLELVGSRILAPYLGGSLYVWTALIGVILTSLSFGYFLGGVVADKAPREHVLGILLFSAGCTVAITRFLYAPFLSFILVIPDVRVSTVLASAILFGPGSILLGMVSPYAVRLRMREVSSSGKVSGNLYALSTAGSILGTFLTGFFLLSRFGTSEVIVGIFVTLILLSFFVWWGGGKSTRAAALALLLFFTPQNALINFDRIGKKLVADIDTNYNRFLIVDDLPQFGVRPRRLLLSSFHAAQSGMYLDRDDDLAIDYLKYYRLADHFNPDIKKALMIGAGAYAYPKDFLKKHPAATLDVVEIDPALQDIATQYFNLTWDERMTIHSQDGRRFLLQSDDLYDSIYIDAFHNTFAIPWHLTTQEMVEETYNHLEPRGVVIVNVVGSLEGENSRFLEAEYKTYSSVFPQVYLFPYPPKGRGEDLVNVLLVAIKSADAPVWTSANRELQAYLETRISPNLGFSLPILTDNFAPVDQYFSSAL